MEKVFEFRAGKHDWNRFEIGVKDGHIVVRDEVGMLQFEDGDVDRLVKGIDEARRRLREEQRMPTKAGAAAKAAAEQEDGHSEPSESTSDTDDEDEVQSTGLGPQFPG